MISRCLNKDIEKVNAIKEDLFNISIKKDSKFEQKEYEPHLIQFNQAP